jgi:hypothetical protein
MHGDIVYNKAAFIFFKQVLGSEPHDNRGNNPGCKSREESGPKKEKPILIP